MNDQVQESPLVRHMLTRLTQCGLPDPVIEYRFCKRRWRFDLAYPHLMIGIEAEGGTWGKRRARHTTGKGYRDDCIKYSNAAIMGWTVLRFTSDMIQNDSFLDFITRAIEAARRRQGG